MAIFGSGDNQRQEPSNSGNTNANTTIITEGSTIKGEISLVCDLFLDGHFEGTIDSHKQITVGKNGKVQGDIHAHNVIIHGQVEGVVDAERVEIKESGHVKGSLISSELVIEAKALFEGESKLKNSDLKLPEPKGKADVEQPKQIKKINAS